MFLEMSKYRGLIFVAMIDVAFYSCTAAMSAFTTDRHRKGIQKIDFFNYLVFQIFL